MKKAIFAIGGFLAAVVAAIGIVSIFKKKQDQDQENE